MGLSEEESNALIEIRHLLLGLQENQIDAYSHTWVELFNKIDKLEIALGDASNILGTLVRIADALDVLVERGNT